AGIYVVVRASSVRLPFRAFFKITGLLLFAMAVVFAGHGVFELQMSGLIRTTLLPWAGRGIPLLGFYPTTQTLAVQGLLLAGAVAALVLLAFDRAPSPPDRPPSKPRSVPPTAAGVGA